MTDGERESLLGQNQASNEPRSTNLTAALIKKTTPNLLSQTSKQTVSAFSWGMSAHISKNASAAMTLITTLQTLFNNVNASAFRHLNTLIGIVNGDKKGALPDYLVGLQKEKQLAIIAHSALILAFGISVAEGVGLRFLIPLWLKAQMSPATYRLAKGFLDVYSFSPFLGLSNQIIKYTNQSTGAENLNYLPNIARFSFIPLVFLLPRDDGLAFIAWAGFGASTAVFLTNVALRKKYRPDSLILSLDNNLWSGACVTDLVKKGGWYALQEIGPVWFDLLAANALIVASSIDDQAAFGEMILFFSFISIWGFGAFSPGINLAATFKEKLSSFSIIHYRTNLIISGLICAGIWSGKNAIVPFFAPDAAVASLTEANLGWLTAKAMLAQPGISFASILMGGYQQYKEMSCISMGSFAFGAIGIFALALTDNLSLSTALIVDGAMNLLSSALTLNQYRKASKPPEEDKTTSTWCGLFNRGKSTVSLSGMADSSQHDEEASSSNTPPS